jgi:OOP family OmpA-OmpF porin
MTSILKTILVCSTLFTMNLYGGGKTIAPPEAEVVDIGEDISSLYVGVGSVANKFHACGNNCTYEDQTYGLMLRAGYEFNAYFGMEVRAIRTFLDKGPFGGVPMAHIGVYAKPEYAISEDFNLYGLLGYGYTKNLGNGRRLNYFDDDHGFSSGLGLEYDLSDKKGDFLESANYSREFDGYGDQSIGWTLFLDYQRLLIKSDVPDMDALSFGVRYDF